MRVAESASERKSKLSFHGADRGSEFRLARNTRLTDAPVDGPEADPIRAQLASAGYMHEADLFIV